MRKSSGAGRRDVVDQADNDYARKRAMMLAADKPGSETHGVVLTTVHSQKVLQKRSSLVSTSRRPQCRVRRRLQEGHDRDQRIRRIGQHSERDSGIGAISNGIHPCHSQKAAPPRIPHRRIDRGYPVQQVGRRLQQGRGGVPRFFFGCRNVETGPACDYGAQNGDPGRPTEPL